MNAVDLLNENEKRILSLLLKGLNVSQVADTDKYTTDEVNNVRLQIIDKFEQSSPVKSPKTRRFQFIAGS
jgi:helix-turn-helix protein